MTKMPIYEYQCRECGAKFEKWLRSLNAISEPECPECGSQKVRKSFSLFGTKATGPSSPAAACGPVG